MAAPTASNSSGAGRWSVVVGLLGAAILPAAIVATRWSTAYTLPQSGFAIPAGAALSVAALLLAARARRAVRPTLEAPIVDGAARLGRALGVLGLALACSGGLAMAVYGVLTYLGERGT